MLTLRIYLLQYTWKKSNAFAIELKKNFGGRSGLPAEVEKELAN